MKWCPSCLAKKPLSEFGSNRSAKDGLCCYCRPCQRAKVRAHYASNEESTWARALRKKYDLSVAEYNRMLESQNGVCKICGNECSRRLAVDHNHSTGQIRGLLCMNCNRAIGHFGDDPKRMIAAAEYLAHC